MQNFQFLDINLPILDLLFLLNNLQSATVTEITNAADDDKPHPIGILPPITIFPPPCILYSDLRTFNAVETNLIQGACILAVMFGDNSAD